MLNVHQYKPHMCTPDDPNNTILFQLRRERALYAFFTSMARFGTMAATEWAQYAYVPRMRDLLCIPMSASYASRGDEGTCQAGDAARDAATP